MSMSAMRKMIRARAEEAEAWQALDAEMGEAMSLSRMIGNKKAELAEAETAVARHEEWRNNLDNEIIGLKETIAALEDDAKVIRGENKALADRLVAEAEAKAEARKAELQVEIERISGVLEQVNASVAAANREADAAEARKTAAEAVLASMRERLA